MRSQCSLMAAGDSFFTDHPPGLATSAFDLRGSDLQTMYAMYSWSLPEHRCSNKDRLCTSGRLSDDLANVTSITDAALTRLYVGTETMLQTIRLSTKAKPDNRDHLLSSAEEPHSAECELKSPAIIMSLPAPATCWTDVSMPLRNRSNSWMVQFRV